MHGYPNFSYEALRMIPRVNYAPALFYYPGFRAAERGSVPDIWRERGPDGEVGGAW